MTRHSHLLAGLAALALACEACSGPAEGDAAAMNTPASAVPGDHLLPMEDMIARFQAGLPAVSGFGGDAPTSQEDLIARFVAAVEDSSVAALRSITVNAAEFAYLYFPGSMFARAPYAQPPEVNWLLLEQNSLKGERRLLREYGGRRLALEGYRCEPQPRVEGATRIWDACRLLVRGSDGVLEELRLFGSVLERDGRFKLLSLANGL